ncbi:hypothetical protein UT300019_13800 [Clostridium sp. CTA-19]
MFRFKFNGNDSILDLKNNCIQLDGEDIELNDDSLNSPKKIYYKMNDDCNLNCIYCFQKKDKKAMKNINLREYNEVISKSINNEEYEIVIFGGEPFIEKNIRNLEYIFSTLEKEKKVSLFTNGCYSEKINMLIKENKEKINCLIITIDGPEKIHNSRRILLNNNSYQTIIKNLIELQKESINFTIQINLDKKNIEYTEDLFNDLHSKFGLKNIQISLNRVLRSEDTISELDLLYKYKDLIIKYDYANIYLNSNLYINLAAYISGSGYYKSRCAIGDTMVLDFSTQKIYSCPQNLDTEIGYFTNNSIILDDMKKNEMKNVAGKKNTKCKICEFSKICSFGCYLERKNLSGNCKEIINNSLNYILKNFDCFFRMEEE